MPRIIYPRLTVSLLAFFFLILAILFFFVEAGLIGYAFHKLGFPPSLAVLLLLLSLLGSHVNIPVRTIVSLQPVFTGTEVVFYGFRYIIPPLQLEQRTVLAVNLGGAIIPFLISTYLLLKVNIIQALLATVVLSFLIHKIARPVRGLGIAVPAILPPIFAAITALLVSPQNAPLIAYISGTMGSLIGADLLNLKRIPEIGAPIASIGGAGTFDGIFLTGIISVLLA